MDFREKNYVNLWKNETQCHKNQSKKLLKNVCILFEYVHKHKVTEEFSEWQKFEKRPLATKIEKI